MTERVMKAILSLSQSTMYHRYDFEIAAMLHPSLQRPSPFQLLTWNSKKTNKQTSSHCLLLFTIQKTLYKKNIFDEFCKRSEKFRKQFVMTFLCCSVWEGPATAAGDARDLCCPKGPKWAWYVEVGVAKCTPTQARTVSA